MDDRLVVEVGDSAPSVLLMQPRFSRIRALRRISVGLAIAMFVIVAAFIRFGSLSGALAYFAGERLIITPTFASFGEGHAGDKRQLCFTVENLTGRHVMLLGASSSCSCMAGKGLPLGIPSGETRELIVGVRLTPKISGVGQRVRFFTDFAEKPVLMVELSGRVLE